jgi:hypothetical protein
MKIVLVIMVAVLVVAGVGLNRAASPQTVYLLASIAVCALIMLSAAIALRYMSGAIL